MISIRKYLDRGNQTRETEELPEDPGLYNLYSALLEDVDQRVLTKARFQTLNTRLSDLRNQVSPGLSSEEMLRIAMQSSQILADYERAVQQQATTTAVEMQHIVGMLNQALMVLAGGSERSVSRLKTIQSSLENALYLKDILALKSSVSETTQFVRDESAREQQAAAKEKEIFEKDLAKAKEFLVAARSGLLGRADGVGAIAGLVSTAHRTCAVIFLFDKMQSVVQRYGSDVAEELIMLLISERLVPLAPGATVYRWSSSSIVAVVPNVPDLASLRARAVALNHAQLVHRAAVGSRTAVLTLRPSYLIADAETPDGLVAEIDRFTGVHP